MWDFFPWKRRKPAEPPPNRVPPTQAAPPVLKPAPPGEPCSCQQHDALVNLTAGEITQDLEKKLADKTLFAKRIRAGRDLEKKEPGEGSRTM